MQHRIETKVGPDGVMILNNLPFHEGEMVEVIVTTSHKTGQDKKEYSLRGKPVLYDKPFDGVAIDDWGVLS